MSKEQVAEAQRLSRDWRPSKTTQNTQIDAHPEVPQGSLDNDMDYSKDTSQAGAEAQNPDTLGSDDVQLKYLLASFHLRNKSPELWSLVPPELKPGIQQGKPEAWAELLATQPELFRKQPFRGMEDLAWEHLMRKKPASSESQPDADSSSPSQG